MLIASDLIINQKLIITMAHNLSLDTESLTTSLLITEIKCEPVDADTQDLNTLPDVNNENEINKYNAIDEIKPKIKEEYLQEVEVQKKEAIFLKESQGMYC